MRLHLGWLAVFGMMAAGLSYWAKAAEPGDKQVKGHVYELRVYHVVPGRMDALKARFRDHTNKLLEKHGMKLIGFWTPTKADDADRQLIYLVEHPSEEAAQKNWAAFREDPDWKTARAASEKDGKIVEKVVVTFLKPTDFSALK
jgi:hypothetical protein